MSRRKSFFSPVIRILKSLRADLQKALKTTNAAAASLTKLKEEPVITGGSAARKRLKTSNYFNPIFWFLQAFWFVARYLTSRKPVAGLQGFPAFAGIVTPLLAGIWLTPSLQEQAAYARGRMSLHAERSEFDEADFFARQLCFLNPEDPGTLLARAVLLDQMDRESDARSIAVQLGNDQKYLPAIEWLSEKDLKFITDSPTVDEQRDQQLLAGLTWLLQLQPDHLKANYMLGTFHMMRAQYAKASPPLKKVTQLSRTPLPEAWFSLAIVQKNLNQTEESKASASLAANGFLERGASESYDVKKTIQTLRALVMAERESEATSLILQTLPQRNPQESSELRWLLGDIYAQWSKRLRLKDRRSVEDLARAVDLTYKALAVAPENPVVTEELIELSCSHDIDDAAIEEQLKIALNSGISPGLVHFILGTRLVTSEQPDTAAALQHFEIAATHNASLPGLLNNMADAMVELEDSDMDLALTLINQAIEIMPDQPHFFDTRGKILLKQGEPLKAIADLEKALAAPAIRGAVHESLSKAYAALNNEKESQLHQQMANQYSTSAAGR
jgi:tetratricopeptide (TPR) repeat protein